MNELPEGWERTTLGDLAALVRGVSFKRDEVASFSGDGLVPIIRAGNVQGGKLNLDDDLVWVPETRVSPDQYLRSSDIVVATSSGSLSVVGKSAKVQSDWHGAHGAFMAAVRPRGVVDPSFLYWWLQTETVRRRWADASAGTNINNLKVGTLTSTVVPLPPLAEQERIVAAIEEHLSRLDAAEALLVTAEERIKVLAQSSIRALFGSREWPWTTLGEVADIKGGVTKDSKRQSDPTFVEVPYLRVANVQRGWLQLDEIATIRVGPDKATSLRLEIGDVLLNEGGDRDKLGRGWVWEGQIEDCIHQNHVFRARLNDAFDPFFVSMHANSWGQAWFEEHGRQTTNLASINLGTLRKLPIPAPPRAEQEVIVAEIRRSSDAQARLLGSINQAGARAGSLRRSVLAAAFSGQLVPQDPDDEPASVLLEQIAAERAAVPSTKRKRKVTSS